MPQLSADLEAFIESANKTVAQNNLGIQPCAVGQKGEFPFPITLTNGLWADDRGWLWFPPTGNEIGSASSGAAVADAKMARLFQSLWPHLNVGTAGYALQDSTGSPVTLGENAQADWDANRRLLVPNYSGRVSVMAGQGAALDNRVVGTVGGEEEHANTAAENGPHGHTGMALTGGVHGHTLTNVWRNIAGNIAWALVSGTYGLNPFSSSTHNGHPHTLSINSSGSGMPHNNMQPYAVYEVFWFVGERA